MAAAKKKEKEKDKSKKKEVKTKNKNKTNSKTAFPEILEKNLARICLTIGILDLGHALFFVVQAMISLVRKLNIYTILALLGTIFWVLMVILLIVGLSKRRPVLVKAWIIFSIIGFIADIALLTWGIFSSVTVDWDHLKEFSIVFFGIFIECLCIYLVYRYYLVMDPCRLIDDPEKKSGKKAKQRQLDPKKCKESQRSAGKTSKKSEKVKKKPVKKK